MKVYMAHAFVNLERRLTECKEKWFRASIEIGITRMVGDLCMAVYAVAKVAVNFLRANRLV
jgi:hypothetical protein